MTQKYYAMDTGFYSSMGIYSFEDRCEITKAVGFDATYISVWDGRNWADVSQASIAKEKYGLDVAGIYVVLDLAQGSASPSNTGIYKMLEVMPEGSTLELAVKTAGPGLRPSDTAGDEKVIAWLREALKIAERRSITILLYTHYTFWIQLHADAIRLCEQINHPNLGIVFCGFHWYAADGRGLAATLKRALPFLRQVNLSGSRRSPLGWGKAATIEALDVGEMDNFAVIALLNRLGYTGYLGYQGWDENGDAYSKLERSLKALKDMRQRAVEYPHWARHVD